MMSFSTRVFWHNGILAALLVSMMAAAFACSEGEEAASHLAIVTTTDFLADWAQEIGEDNVNVFSLLPPGADPHSFQPGSRDIARIADADLVLSVGLGLEDDWLSDLIANASADSEKIVTVTDVIEPLENPDYSEEEEEEGEEGDEEGEDEHHDEGPLDPHFWFDPVRVEHVIDHVASLFAAKDPDRASMYLANASDYQHELQELHRFIELEMEAIPTSNRLLVTSHDSLQYFASRYDMTVVGTVIPSATTETESSPQQLSDLIETIQEHEVPVVFGEVTVS